VTTAAGLLGLPSLHALDRSCAGGAMRIWLCTARTDMRCGFDRLAALAQQVTGEDPLNGHLFVFTNRAGDRLKLLVWDRDGFVLIYKRLEEGRFKLPRVDASQRSIHLRPSELAMLLDGIDLSSVKRGKRYSHRSAPAPVRS
jgi:transposase